MSHKWSQITDLPQDFGALASPELKSVAGIWKEQSARLQQMNAVQTFNAKLARRWSIETGVIENVYNLEKGVTLLLVEKGIEASLIPHGTSDRPAECHGLKHAVEVKMGVLPKLGMLLGGMQQISGVRHSWIVA